MAATDYKSSLPVRSEADGVDARVQVKIVDKSNPGTQQMIVDTDSNAHVEMHGNDSTGTDRVMRLSEEGAPNGDGVYDGSNNTKPASAGLTAQTRNAAAADSRQVERPTAKRGTTDTTNVSLDVALHDEDGNKFSTSNPLPVILSNEEVGTAVHDYDESATAVVAGGSYTRTYVVATAAFTLKRIRASGSGRFRLQISVGSAMAPDKRYVVFNSTANPNIDLEIPTNSIVALADVIELIFTNMDAEDFTAYSTIEGTTGA